MHSCLTRYYFEAYNKKENAPLKGDWQYRHFPIGPVLVEVPTPWLPCLMGRRLRFLMNRRPSAGALNLLQSAGLLKVKGDAGIKPSLNDITSNPKHLKFKEVDPATTARALKSVDASIINGN